MVKTNIQKAACVEIYYRVAEENQKHSSQYNLAKPQQAGILLNTSANYQNHTTCWLG
jgi:hypothetical protein